MNAPARTTFQCVKDFLTFPIRAFTLIHDDWLGFSSLDTERFNYVKKEVEGYCLDVGCGRYNRFIDIYMRGNGKGIDVYKYDGLTDDHIIEDITKFPFDSESFDAITFIANVSHIPESLRDIELGEAYRCLKRNGIIVITEGNPVAQVMTHKVTEFYDKFLGTSLDVDGERGMHEEEAFYLTDSEIIDRVKKAGFKDIRKKYFWTQWALNHLFVAKKKS